MNTEDFLRLGVPLGQATRLATDFNSKFILGGGASGSAEFIPLPPGTGSGSNGQRPPPESRGGWGVWGSRKGRGGA